MEQLSKSQIILLTLLVSFVTSIATGIVTVSLMDQAPPAIAQTVNRVIERTVERVVPSGQTASVVTQEKTIVVKESDLIAQALQRINPSIVRLYTSSTDSPVFMGIGIVLNASGTIAFDASALGEGGDAFVERADGSRVRAFVTARDDQAGLAYLTSATTTTEGKVVAWAPVKLSVGHPTLGDTVITLAGRTVTRIADGIVTSLIPAADSVPQIIETNVAKDSIVEGSPLINTDGTLIGISTSVSRVASPSGFVIAAALMRPSTVEKK